MGIYLLKFSVCLGLLLLYYKLVLETTHLHNFKRYFLLSAFIFSLGIPLITFTRYISVEPMVYSAIIDNDWTGYKLAPSLKTDIIAIVLWSIYVLGTVILTIKFLTNLWSLIKNIRNNPKRRSGRFHHVLLQELIAPHTFFNYIFFSRKDYEDQKIPQEVFWHEETHARQKHSLDILFLELLSVLFWFHPLVYWAKHLIKLNHEFLADRSVLNQGASIPYYQNIILAFSTSNDYRSTSPPLTNAIRYSSIKKRIVVIKTRTSKRVILLRTSLLLPLSDLLLLSFSTTEIKNVEMPSIGNEIKQGEKSTIKYVFQDTATVEMVKEYNDIIIKKNKLPESRRIYRQTDVERIRYIYSLMTENQKKTAEKFPNFVTPLSTPDQISQEKKQSSSSSSKKKENIEIKEGEEKVYTGNLMAKKAMSIKKIDSMNRLDIPPPPPTIAIHPNTQNYSNALKQAIQGYLKESRSYRAAVSSYHIDHRGSVDDLEKTYIKVMQFYDQYKKLALEENVFMYPAPLYNNPKKEFGDKDPRLIGTRTDISSPPLEDRANQKVELINPLDFSEKVVGFKALPAPTLGNALRYLKDKEHKGAEIYFNGMKIDHAQAIILLESTKASIGNIWKTDKKEIIKLMAVP